MDKLLTQNISRLKSSTTQCARNKFCDYKNIVAGTEGFQDSHPGGIEGVKDQRGASAPAVRNEPGDDLREYGARLPDRADQ